MERPLESWINDFLLSQRSMVVIFLKAKDTILGGVCLMHTTQTPDKNESAQMTNPPRPTAITLLKTSVGLIFANKRLLFAVTLPIMLASGVLFALVIFGSTLILDRRAALVATTLAGASIVMFASIVNAIVWHRAAGWHGNPTSLTSTLKSQPILRYVVRGAAIFLPVLAAVFALEWATAEVRKFWSVQFGIGGMPLLLSSALSIFSAEFTLPAGLTLFGFLFPAIALGHKIGIRQSIRASLQYFWPMLIAFILLQVAYFFLVDGLLHHVLNQLALSKSSTLQMFEDIMTFAIDIFAILINITLLTQCYLHWHTTSKTKKPA